MSESDTFSSYAGVEPINDDTPLPDLNTFLGILKRMRGCEGADGLPWPENAPRESGEDRARVGGAADGAGGSAFGRPLPGGSGARAASG